MKLHIAFSSVLGIGYAKGGGTIAALFFAIIWIFLPAGYTQGSWQVFITALFLLAGTYSANCVESIWGKDSSRVVMDEFAGMAVTLLFAPHHLYNALLGLLLFRFFDIAKPLGIRRLEQWPGGWGVMADDLLAALYSMAILLLVNQSEWWQALLKSQPIQ